MGPVPCSGEYRCIWTHSYKVKCRVCSYRLIMNGLSFTQVDCGQRGWRDNGDRRKEDRTGCSWCEGTVWKDDFGWLLLHPSPTGRHAWGSCREYSFVSGQIYAYGLVLLLTDFGFLSSSAWLLRLLRMSRVILWRWREGLVFELFERILPSVHFLYLFLLKMTWLWWLTKKKVFTLSFEVKAVDLNGRATSVCDERWVPPLLRLSQWSLER